MVFLPRLARALNKPGIATVLGLVLVAVAIIGITSGDIRTLWAIIILVVGAINLLRAIPTRDVRCEYHLDERGTLRRSTGEALGGSGPLHLDLNRSLRPRRRLVQAGEGTSEPAALTLRSYHAGGGTAGFL